MRSLKNWNTRSQTTSAQIDAIDALRRRGAPLMQIQMRVTDFYQQLYAIEAERSTPVETEAVIRFASPSELGLAAPAAEAPATHEPDDSVAAPPPLAKAAKANGTP